MPIYEYVCTQCNHELEAIQKMSDDALEFCPECSSQTLKKKISAVAFQLKGTGWYVTDFKDKKPNDKVADKGDTQTNGKADAKADKPVKKDIKTAEPSSAKQASAA